MKYRASEQTRLLVVRYQNTTEIGQLLYPALNMIAKTVEAIFKLEDSNTENFSENLQLTINANIDYAKFQECLVQLQKTNEPLAVQLNILRLLFEQNEKIYAQEEFKSLTQLKPTSLKQYTENVKNILSEHINAICVQLKKNKEEQELLQDPLYQEAMRLLARRKLRKKSLLNNSTFFTMKVDNKVTDSSKSEQKDTKVANKQT